MILKCILTSYESGPLFNIEIKLGIKVFEGVLEPGGAWQSGRELQSAVGTIALDRLDPGASNGVAFYAINIDEGAFMEVMAPNEIMAQRLGNSARSIVRLVETQNRTFTLSPLVPLKHAPH